MTVQFAQQVLRKLPASFSEPVFDSNSPEIIELLQQDPVFLSPEAAAFVKVLVAVERRV